MYSFCTITFTFIVCGRSFIKFIFSINIETALELPDTMHKAGKRAKLVS